MVLEPNGEDRCELRRSILTSQIVSCCERMNASLKDCNNFRLRLAEDGLYEYAIDLYDDEGVELFADIDFCPFCGKQLTTEEIPAVVDERSDPRYVYTISVFSHTGGETRIRRKNWGNYFDESTARRVIEQNQPDISECDHYHFCLLAKKGEGPLALSEAIQWYEFIWDGNTFIRADKIECPEQYREINGESRFHG
jgi:hypothetical protein